MTMISARAAKFLFIVVPFLSRAGRGVGALRPVALKSLGSLLVQAVRSRYQVEEPRPVVRLVVIRGRLARQVRLRTGAEVGGDGGQHVPVEVISSRRPLEVPFEGDLVREHEAGHLAWRRERRREAPVDEEGRDPE